jgi:hypothetical protein
MLQQEDLDAAVAKGILTEAQATGLREFALQREKERIAILGHEERFRFMRGFNDFFFAVGVILLTAGLAFFAGSSTIGNLVGAAVIWALAELLVRRMRLVLPGILLAIFFVVFVFHVGFWAAPEAVPTLDFPTNAIDGVLYGAFGGVSPLAKVAKSLIATLAALGFYVRFRLPFALMLVAAGLVLTIVAAVGPSLTPWLFSMLLLVCGLSVFAAAMFYDLSDPERTTRRADCAFWLHLLAAPLIVHSLVSAAAPTMVTINAVSAVTIIAIVALLAVVAVMIDRRALFVSALSYLGIVIAYAIRTAGISASEFVLFTTLLILGVLVLTLGVGWLPLRRPLMTLIPAGLARRLPPVVPV